MWLSWSCQQGWAWVAAAPRAPGAQQSQNSALLAPITHEPHAAPAQILVWHYPDTQQTPVRVETQHQANIFGVKFLPLNDDRRLVSGAMDYTVQMHTLECSPAPVAAGAPMGASGGAGRGARRAPAVSTTVYSCHRGRVKVGDGPQGGG